MNHILKNWFSNKACSTSLILLGKYSIKNLAEERISILLCSPRFPIAHSLCHSTTQQCVEAASTSFWLGAQNKPSWQPLPAPNQSMQRKCSGTGSKLNLIRVPRKRQHRTQNVWVICNCDSQNVYCYTVPVSVTVTAPNSDKWPLDTNAKKSGSPHTNCWGENTVTPETQHKHWNTLDHHYFL